MICKAIISLVCELGRRENAVSFNACVLYVLKWGTLISLEMRYPWREFNEICPSICSSDWVLRIVGHLARSPAHSFLSYG